jgi:hypothetical protein
LFWPVALERKIQDWEARFSWFEKKPHLSGQKTVLFLLEVQEGIILDLVSSWVQQPAEGQTVAGGNFCRTVWSEAQLFICFRLSSMGRVRKEYDALNENVPPLHIGVRPALRFRLAGPEFHRCSADYRLDRQFLTHNAQRQCAGPGADRV